MSLTSRLCSTPPYLGKPTMKKSVCLYHRRSNNGAKIRIVTVCGGGGLFQCDQKSFAPPYLMTSFYIIAQVKRTKRTTFCVVRLALCAYSYVLNIFAFPPPSFFVASCAFTLFITFSAVSHPATESPSFPSSTMSPIISSNPCSYPYEQ